jgi:hypothetical protein
MPRASFLSPLPSESWTASSLLASIDLSHTIFATILLGSFIRRTIFYFIHHIHCRQQLILRNYSSHNLLFVTLSLYSIFVFLRFFFSGLTLVLLSTLYSLRFVATLPVFQSSELFELQSGYSISQLFWFFLLSSMSA